MQKTIIVGFSRPKKPSTTSKIMMKVMKTPYSHVYLSFKSNSLDRTLIYQANKHGCYFIGKERFAEENIVVEYFPITLTEEQYTTALQTCVDLAGLQYGFVEILGLGIRNLLKAWGWQTDNPLPNKKTYVCSQLVDKVLKAVGIDTGVKEDNIEPVDINRYLKGLSFK